MSISRREVLSGAGATILPMQGIPTLGGLALGHAREEDLDLLFERLDANIAAFRDATMPPKVQAWFEARDLPGDTFHVLFSGLLTTGLVRDLPAPLQAKPEVQQRLRAELIDIGAVALGLKDLFRSLRTDERREVGRRIAADATLVERIKGAMEPWFGPGGVEPERREQVFQGVDRICWELANGDPDAVFDEPVRQIERFSAMADTLAERQARADSADAPVGNGGSTAGDGPAPGGEDPCADILALYPGKFGDGVMPTTRMGRVTWYRTAKADCEDPEGRYDKRFTPYRQRFLAGRCLIIGGALTGLGLISLPILVGMCILTPALALLITALVLYIVSERH